MTYTEMAIRIGVIVLLSGLIGLDRELKHKPAGAKTHIMVGLRSTVFTIVSIYMYLHYKGETQVDPGRIAAQVVTGIGFLGAGTIIQSGGNVIGLTTAASLWATAGIGLAVGSGMYVLAAMATGAMLLVFLVLNRITVAVENSATKIKSKSIFYNNKFSKKAKKK